MTKKRKDYNIVNITHLDNEILMVIILWSLKKYVLTIKRFKKQSPNLLMTSKHQTKDLVK